MGYTCWGDDHEDLSKQVAAAIRQAQERGDWNFAFEEEDRPSVEIEVHCSQGHRNLFDV